MEKIKEFMEENLYEEVIYENVRGNITVGCVEDCTIYPNAVRVVLDTLEITVDNIIKHLTCLLEFGELCINSKEGIHKFYII